MTGGSVSPLPELMSGMNPNLRALEQGQDRPGEELLPLVYEELRKLAAHKMALEAPGQTLQPTALVHEAWLRLGADGQSLWKNRARLFAAAAQAMRQILVERARRRTALKRGGGARRLCILLPPGLRMCKIPSGAAKKISEGPVYFFPGEYAWTDEGTKAFAYWPPCKENAK